MHRFLGSLRGRNGQFLFDGIADVGFTQAAIQGKTDGLMEALAGGLHLSRLADDSGVRGHFHAAGRFFLEDSFPF
jgi:hypothetical protein